MADQAPALDAATRVALQQLADIAVPPRISFVPQTWGWAALLVVLLAVAALLVLAWRRRHEANRYRREALVELGRIEAAIADDTSRPQAVLALPPLVKRVALAAWPRGTVAPLSGAAWVAFLGAHAGGRPLPEAASWLFDDAEYRAGDRAAIGADEARSLAGAVRQWIEGHRVSA